MAGEFCESKSTHLQFAKLEIPSDLYDIITVAKMKVNFSILKLARGDGQKEKHTKLCNPLVNLILYYLGAVENMY